MEKQRKKFILGMTACAFLIWAMRAVIAGVIQASAALFAKKQWEKWKKGGKSEKNSSDINSDNPDSDSNFSEKK